MCKTMDVDRSNKTNNKAFSSSTSGSPFGWSKRKGGATQSVSSDDEYDLRLSDREEVGAFSSDDNEIQVGEELFIELCDAWIKTHGAKVLKQVLSNWDKLKNKKPKDYDDQGQLKK